MEPLESESQDSQGPSTSKKRLTSFNEKWLNDPDFNNWLQKKTDFLAHCKTCNTDISVQYEGRRAIMVIFKYYYSVVYVPNNHQDQASSVKPPFFNYCEHFRYTQHQQNTKKLNQQGRCRDVSIAFSYPRLPKKRVKSPKPK